jgi:hypothetical protein
MYRSEAEIAPYRHWKFNAPTGIGLQEFLSYCHVQHSPKDSQLLMNGGWLENSHLSEAERGPDSNHLSKAITKVHLDIVRRDIHQFSRSKGALKVLCHPKIHLVRLLCSDRWFRVVFQEEIRPLRQTQL